MQLPRKNQTYKYKTLYVCTATIISQKFEIPDDLQTIPKYTSNPVSATHKHKHNTQAARTLAMEQDLNAADREFRVMNCGHRNKAGEEGKGRQP